MELSNNLNEFKESQLSNLSRSSMEELSSLENDISKEFNSLSKEYLDSRVVRINHLIESINYFIHEFTEDENEWLAIYNKQTETINNIKTNTEDLILSRSMGSGKNICNTLDEYEKTLQALFGSISSPLQFLGNYKLGELVTANGRKLRQLPFEKQFDNVISPYRTDLQSVLNESNYNSLLLESNTGANSRIIWKQYQSDLTGYKNKLIDETYQQLNELHKDYYNINHEKQRNKAREGYYRSVISVSDLKRSYDTLDKDKDSLMSDNHDNYYDTNNSYFKKNKIELTHEKRGILSRIERFERNQAAHETNPAITYKLNSCTGLSDLEIDNDISVLRNSIANKSIIMEDEPEIIEPQTDTNEEQAEISEELMKQKYKQLLSMSSDIESQPKSNSLRSILADSSPPLSASNLPKLTIPELPPLEAFPKIQDKSAEV